MSVFIRIELTELAISVSARHTILPPTTVIVGRPLKVQPLKGIAALLGRRAGIKNPFGIWVNHRHIGIRTFASVPLGSWRVGRIHGVFGDQIR